MKVSLHKYEKNNNSGQCMHPFLKGFAKHYTTKHQTEKGSPQQWLQEIIQPKSEKHIKHLKFKWIQIMHDRLLYHKDSKDATMACSEGSLYKPEHHSLRNSTQ